jgi:hypothetical protein
MRWKTLMCWTTPSSWLYASSRRKLLSWIGGGSSAEIAALERTAKVTRTRTTVPEAYGD